MRALAFCRDLSYINNIDLLWEGLVFLSFCLHTASVQCFQDKPAISFDGSPPPNFLPFQHGRPVSGPPEARSPAVPEACAFLHGSQQWGPGWRTSSPLQHPNPSPCSSPTVSEGAGTGESPYSCHCRCMGWQMAVQVQARLQETEVGQRTLK